MSVSRPRPASSFRLVAACALALAAVSGAQAANLAWDPGSTPGGTVTAPTGSGGNGTWDLATGNWSNGTGDVLWTDNSAAGTDVANFGGTAGTVNFNTNLSALGLVFSTTGYSLSGTGILKLGASGITASALSNGTTTLSQPISLLTNQTWNVGTGATLAVSGTVTGNKDITKSGAGTLTLSGGAAGTPSAVQQFQPGGGGTVNISGFMNTSSKFAILAGTVNWTATGTHTGSYNGVGDGGASIMNVTAGTYTSTPGSATFIGNGVAGTLNISGGTFALGNNNALYIGSGYNNNGGGTGILNVSSAGTFSTGTTTGVIQLGSSNTVAGSGTINLDGGTFSTARSITKGGGTGATAAVYYNGGTFQARAATAAVAAGVSGYIRDGGAIFDTNTFNMTLAQTLVHSNKGGDLATDGGLTKKGLGALTLTGSNTYNGVTTIMAGTLLANSSVGSSTGTGNVTGSASGTLGGSGLIAPEGTSNVQIAGSIAPGSGGIGTLTFDSTNTTAASVLALSSGATFKFELGATQTSDKISLLGSGTGDLSFSSNVIDFTDLTAGALVQGSYTLFTASAAGAYSGLTVNGGNVITAGLTIGAGLSGYAGSTLQISGNDIVLNVVPEPSSAVAIMSGMGMLLGLQRFRRRGGA